MAKTSKNILDEARASIKQIDVEQARKMLDQPGTVLVDVRESDEWRQGHIPQALGIPRGFLELRIEEKVPDHKAPVILQCASGTRSLLAARALREMGYENVYNLNGGFNAWKDKGLPWAADRQFTQDEITRYSRHFVIPEVGEKGQAKLLDSKVLILGTGALGSPASLYLAAAGVGTLGLVDYDVVVNCGDNFPTRYLINDACVFLKKPLVDGAIFRFEGNATVFHPAAGGPCYRCLYPEPAPPDMAPSCAEAGVLGALPGVIGSIEALEAIKLIVGAGKPLIGKMVYFDTLSNDYVRILKIRRNPDCPVCSDHPTQTTLIDYEAFCGLAAPTNGSNAHAVAAGR